MTLDSALERLVKASKECFAAGHVITTFHQPGTQVLCVDCALAAVALGEPETFCTCQYFINGVNRDPACQRHRPVAQTEPLCPPHPGGMVVDTRLGGKICLACGKDWFPQAEPEPRGMLAIGPQQLHPECALVCGLAACRGEADAREERFLAALTSARAAIRLLSSMVSEHDRVASSIEDHPAVKAAVKEKP